MEPCNERSLHINLEPIIMNYDRCIGQLGLKGGHKAEKLGGFAVVKYEERNLHGGRLPFLTGVLDLLVSCVGYCRVLLADGAAIPQCTCGNAERLINCQPAAFRAKLTCL